MKKIENGELETFRLNLSRWANHELLYGHQHSWPASLGFYWPPGRRNEKRYFKTSSAGDENGPAVSLPWYCEPSLVSLAE